MRYKKKLLSTITIFSIISQLLPTTSITINAQQITNTTNNTNSIQTQDESINSNISINGSFTKDVHTEIRNEVHLFGENGTEFKVKFNTSNKRLEIENIGNEANIAPTLGNKKYISLILFDSTGKVKKIVSINGNENVLKAYNEFNNTEFEYGDRLKIYHEKAGSLVKITDTVIDQTQSFNDGVNKDILAEYDFEITNSGLKQVKANKYLLNNTITLSGVGCQEGVHRFELLLDRETMQLKVNILAGLGYSGTHPFHSGFGNNKYINIKLIDKDGNIKKEVSMNGNDNVKKVNPLNNVDFEYGDRLRIFHEEADWRTKISGNVNDENGEMIDLSQRTSKNLLINHDFEITESGLRLVTPFSNELNKTKITLSGVGCQEGVHRFELTLDPLTMQLKVNILAGLGYTGTHPFHSGFGNNKYINIKLIDKDGNIKKEVSMNGNDNVKKVNPLNNVDFEYGDHLKIFHEEADWRAKIAGNVYTPQGTLVDLSERTSKDTLTRYDFEITKSGLQEVPTFTNELNNRITLSGVGCQEGTHKFDLSLDPLTKQLKVSGVINATYHGFHPYFGNNKYINIKLLNKNGVVKKEFSLTGNEIATKANTELNNVNFEYGDRLRIFHEEAGWRTKISGNVYDVSGTLTNQFANGTSKNILNTYDFMITTSGLKLVPAFTNELNNTITLSGVGCQEGTHKFELTLDPLTKKLKINGLIGVGYTGTHPFHPSYPNEYINIKLLDEYGNVKKEFSMKGPENVKKAQNELNDTDFEYGDRLRIFHQQAGWRLKIAGNVYDTELQKVDLSQSTSKDILNTYDFRITKSGLQEIPKYRYYPFIINYNLL